MANFEHFLPIFCPIADFLPQGWGPRILVKYSPVLKSVKILMKRVYIIYISGLNGFRNTFVILIKGHS